MMSRALFSILEVVLAVSQAALTWERVEKVAVSFGRLRKRPAPMEAWLENKDMPARSWGWKPPVVVRAMPAEAAWKGMAVMVVLSLWHNVSGFWGGRGRCGDAQALLGGLGSVAYV